MTICDAVDRRRVDINIDKQIIISNAIAQLAQELASTLIAAENAHKAATDDQSIAETQYDTLAIEQSYLAEGQSRRVEELKAAIKSLENISVENLQPSQNIKIGSLVQLEKDATKQRWFFIAPAGAGFRYHLKPEEIQVEVVMITPQSPIGSALMGLELDDEINVNIAGNIQADFITKVI